MNTQMVHHFSVTLNQPWLKKGNIIHYNLDYSLSKDIIWQINVFPTNDSNTVVSVQKKNWLNMQTIESENMEARNALMGSFTNIGNIVISGTAPNSTFDFQRVIQTEIAFTLRTIPSNSQGMEALKQLAMKKKKKEANDVEFEVETGNVKCETSVVCVYGLLSVTSTENYQPQLRDCITQLCEIFDPKAVMEVYTWASYCMNVPGWKKSIGLL